MDIGAVRFAFPSRVAPRLSGPPPRDGYRPTPSQPFLVRPGLRAPQPEIPDARAIASDPTLRYVDLNRAITGCYVQFGQLFQKIADPGFDGGSQVNPTWYAIGAYASRGAGKGMMAATVARSVADRLTDESPLEEDVLRDTFPALSDDDAKALGQDVRAQFSSKDERVAATFLIALALALRDDLSKVIHDGLLDPRVLVISVGRLLELAHGPDIKEQLQKVADTMRNGLEDGNRRIVSDIGVNGQAYLEWRRTQGDGPSPADVLGKFVLSDKPEQAREMYQYASDCLASDEPLPNDFEHQFPDDRYDSRNALVCGFALYELARLTSDPTRKGRAIAFANNLLAFREQYVAAQPAFTPAQTLPGEVDRVPLFQMLSPAVDIQLRFGTWSYTRFAADHLPPRDGSILTPRVCEYNWAAFDDRWPGIMDAFDNVNQHAAAMWPMPNPDPGSPL